MVQLAVRNMFNILIELTQYLFEHVDFQNVEIVNMFNVLKSSEGRQIELSIAN